VRSPRELAAVADLRTVVFQFGCSYRQRLEAYLGRQGIVVARPLEFGSLDAIISCVSAGVGVTMLPRGVVAAPAAAGKVALHRLPREQAQAETLFIRRRDRYASAAMTAFLQLARDVQPASPPSREAGVRDVVAMQAQAAQ
jgi:DNA-binding transcriptional LysR family regulator